MSLVSKSEIPGLYPSSVAAQTGLCLIWLLNKPSLYCYENVSNGISITDLSIPVDAWLKQ